MDTCWPRSRRKVAMQVPKKLCTCLAFCMHGDCEHVVFVKAIEGDLNLGSIPVQQKKGRKRKQDARD